MECQNKVKDFTEKYELKSDLNIRLLDLISELGELSKEVIKGSEYGTKSFELTGGFSDEIGDVFFSLCCVANEAGTDLEKALRDSIQKYEVRFKEKADIGSGR